MKSRILILLLLFAALAGYCADERVTLRITITNLPVTGDNLSFSAPATKVITWSNVTASTWVATNTTVNGCATNLFLQLAAFAPWTPRPAFLWANTNAIDILGEVNQAIAVTNSGTWATLTLSTQTVTRLTTVRVPIASEVGDTNRTNVASLLVKGVTDHSTNAFGSNSIAMTHALMINTIAQTVLGAKTFNQIAGGTNTGTLYRGAYSHIGVTNAHHLHGSNVYAYHGYWTNGRADNMISSNLINYGSAISSPGTNGTGSEQFGTAARAIADAALAVGNAALADAEGGTAIGQGAAATNVQSIALGTSAVAGGRNSIAIGVENLASGTNSIALGGSATHAYSVAIGLNSATTTNNQMVLGSSTDVYRVDVPGRFNAASGLTNNIYTGTNHNLGDWADEEVNVSTLANGNNIAIAPTNVFMRLIAGPTANFTINGIQNGRSGKQLWIWNDTGQQMTIAHESGVDPTPANRIYCTSGGDTTFGTNALVFLKYSGARSRWVCQINTNAITLANNSVTDGILRDSAATSVIGRSANSTGDPADIAFAANGQVLVRTNDTLVAGKIALTNASIHNAMPVGQTNTQVLSWDGTSNVWTNRTVKDTYELTFWAGVLTLNAADSTTYYVGANWRVAPSTTYATVNGLVPFSGTVTKAIFAVNVGGTLGTTEDVSLYVRVNDTTDSAATAQDWDAAYRVTASGDLSLAVAAGDTIVVKIVTPAWATNPTTVTMQATVFIERTQ